MTCRSRRVGGSHTQNSHRAALMSSMYLIQGSTNKFIYFSVGLSGEGRREEANVKKRSGLKGGSEKIKICI